MCGSIRSQSIGIRWRLDLDAPMASVMAIKSEVIGEWVEVKKVEVGRKLLKMILACLAVL